MESLRKYKDNDMMLENSGGSIFYGHAGMDIYFNHFCFNAAFQIPVKQSLNKPQPELKYRFIAGITFAFN